MNDEVRKGERGSVVANATKLQRTETDEVSRDPASAIFLTERLHGL